MTQQKFNSILDDLMEGYDTILTDGKGFKIKASFSRSSGEEYITITGADGCELARISEILTIDEFEKYVMSCGYDTSKQI